jgi:AmmeMemoRadiSam system protein A
VTLKQRGDLRGCIGYIEPREPLVRTVIENAKNASTSDPRFPPVRPADLPELSIEVSALTEPAEVDSPEGFVVGRHGIIIRKDGRSAVFLPQVAPEQGWDRATTLAHLCRKAGLPADEWRNPGMKFLVFEAEVFHEDEAKGAAAPR